MARAVLINFSLLLTSCLSISQITHANTESMIANIPISFLRPDPSSTKASSEENK
jgi:hypothetical protein